MKDRRILLGVLMIGALLLSACQGKSGNQARTAVPVKGSITLATTSTTMESGILDFILPVFTAETGWTVNVVADGAGAVFQMGRDGQADVLMVHGRVQELQFVAEGHGLERFDVMYNDFLVVGPESPIDYNDDALRTFRAIANQSFPFVSRGDNSAAHTMERSLWEAAGMDTARLSGYISLGQDMGATLRMANDLGAYTLTDRATWFTQRETSKLVTVCEKSPLLINNYAVITVNPAKNPSINAEGAQDFVNWIISPSAQSLIGEYGQAEFGSSIFTPGAQ